MDTIYSFRVVSTKPGQDQFVNWSDAARYEFPLPSLDEQRRSARAMQAIDAASSALASVSEEAEKVRRAALVNAFRPNRGSRDLFPTNWDVKSIGDAGDVQLGQQRHPKYQSGANVRPYLRVANVMDGWLDLSDVNEMNFPPEGLGKFELVPGDILLNEGQSTELVGRSAIYRGEMKGCCFQKSLLRFRCADDLIPEFAHAFFQHCLYTGQFARIAAQTTSMAHLTAVRFEKMRMPVPPRSEQTAIADRNESLTRAVSDARRRRELLGAMTFQVLAGAPTTS
jgi:type I restriction enzyme S subunit